MSLGFLNGVENLSYREILHRANIKNVCLTYSYAKRIRHARWQDILEEFEAVMVVPGFISTEEVSDYIDFLNKYEELINFAISYPGYFTSINDAVTLPIVPLYGECDEAQAVAVTTKDINYPFRVQKLHRARHMIHALGVYHPLAATFNTGLWMTSRHGYVYQFNRGKFTAFDFNSNAVKTSIARQLILDGYDISLRALLKSDWKEEALLNAIAWGRYIETLENK